MDFSKLSNRPLGATDYQYRKVLKGEAAFLELQRIKKRLQRAAVKQRTEELKSDGDRAEHEEKTNIIKGVVAANNKFIDKIYAKKVASLAEGHHLTRDTVALHVKRISNLQFKMTGEHNINNLKFLKDWANVIAYIDINYNKDNTKMAYILSINSIISAIPTGFKRVYKNYFEHALQYSNRIKAQISLQEQSPVEEQKFADMANVFQPIRVA